MPQAQIAEDMGLHVRVPAAAERLRQEDDLIDELLATAHDSPEESKQNNQRYATMALVPRDAASRGLLAEA